MITSATKTSTAPRDIPQSISIVTQQLIQDQGMRRQMADVVRYIPGITMAQGEGQARRFSLDLRELRCILFARFRRAILFPGCDDAGTEAGEVRKLRNGSEVLRRVLFWSHLAAGLAAGLVILLMSVTGVLLTYEKQVLAWADRGAFRPADGSPMCTEALLAGLPGVTSLTMKADSSEPWTASMGPKVVLVDPSTGGVLGPQSQNVRAFFRTVTDWHRWLGAKAANRAGARTVTGAANLTFLFLVVSGLYLWFPRKWAWPNLRAVLWFRGGLSGKARDFNWHNVAGFWCCVPLFFVVLSGVVISYPWASDLVYRASGVEPPARGKGKGGPPPAARATSLAHLDAVVARAKLQDPAWRSITFQIPATDDAPVTFNIDAGMGGQPQKRSTVTLDRASGAVIRSTSFADQDPGQRARSWMRFVHTGEYYGLAGQTIAGLASAGGALLVWTGFALAYRRFRAQFRAWKTR